MVKPFDVMQRPFLRDVIFYIAATFWAFTVMWRKKITTAEAVGMYTADWYNYDMRRYHKTSA